MHFDRHLQLYFLYHSLGLLWTAEALLHLGFCSTSGIVVRWQGLGLGLGLGLG